MGVRVEWISAKYANVNLLAPGDEWVGDDMQDDEFVLAMSGDEVTAVHGSREHIEAFARDVYEAVFGEDHALKTAVLAVSELPESKHTADVLVRLMQEIANG